jgi:hypothetical protein
MSDTIPEVNAMAYGNLEELVLGMRAPCMVCVGKDRVRVTAENYKGVCLGLFLASLFQEQIDAAKSDRQDNDH